MAAKTQRQDNAPPGFLSMKGVNPRRWKSSKLFEEEFRDHVGRIKQRPIVEATIANGKSIPGSKEARQKKKKATDKGDGCVCQ